MSSIDDVTSGGDIVRKVGRLHKSFKVTGKRKQATSPSVKEARYKLQKAPPQTSKVAGDAFDPLDVDSDPDIHEFPSAKELKDFTDCLFVVAHVIPPLCKKHLRDISLEKLCDIHDMAYMRKAILDNALENQTRHLISALENLRASCGAIREREVEKYAELKNKCNEALQDLDKNPLVLDMRAEIETLQGQVDRLHSDYSRLQDRAIVVFKVVHDVATKLIHSDEMGFLVAKLVKAAMFRGKCAAFEDVASLKEPFSLEKMLGYRSSSKEEFDQAGDGLANASYPFLAEVIADPYAFVE
ncbi:hypothetical protein Tco_0552122 [Tanacetum coccineum]